MDRSEFEQLGNACKALEGRQAQVLMPGVPQLARLDGRAFHTFTKGLGKPYDVRFSALMWETTRTLLEHFQGLLAYTQSDEITLCWLGQQDPLFGGRVSKIESNLAGLASGVFNKLLPEYLPEKAESIPHFDCRAWSVPDWKAVYDVFRWREEDATRNSLSMLVQAHFSHGALQGKSRAEQHNMLHDMGLNWNNEPYWFKRGQYMTTVKALKVLTEEELARMPLKGRMALGPNPQVIRSSVERLELEPVSSYTPEEFLAEIHRSRG